MYEVCFIDFTAYISKPQLRGKQIRYLEKLIGTFKFYSNKNKVSLEFNMHIILL